MTIFVTKEELETKRTPKELAMWIEKKLADLKEIPEAKEAVRLRKGLCKELVEEVYALSIYSNHVFGDRGDVTILPVIGSQNYDAIIEENGKKKKLEITLAHEGEQEYLRMLLLHREGRAPATGEIKKTGSKKTGIVLEAECIARDADEIFRDQCELIKWAIERKIGKVYEEGTDLLVMFSDAMGFREPVEFEKLKEFINNEMGPLVEPSGLGNLHIVGWSKDIRITWSRDK